jgi:hypothetical protein
MGWRGFLLGDVMTNTTKLRALNTLLANIGAAPVNSVDTPSADVALALATLDEASISVQNYGWHFNTEDDYPMTPDSSGFIALPDNVILVDVDVANNPNDLDVVVRGNRLYDRANHTYVFTEGLKARIVRALEWEDLPQAARTYIMILAARMFQDRAVGSEKHHGFTLRDEQMALANLKRFEAQTGDYNIFDNHSVSRVIDRYYPHPFLG